MWWNALPILKNKCPSGEPDGFKLSFYGCFKSILFLRFSFYSAKFSSSEALHPVFSYLWRPLPDLSSTLLNLCCLLLSHLFLTLHNQQSVRLPMIPYYLLCRICVTCYISCHASVHHMLPTRVDKYSQLLLIYISCLWY